jgi:hypothetical protein
MWSLVEKNPKETGMLEKIIQRIKKIVKIMFFSIGMVST